MGSFPVAYDRKKKTFVTSRLGLLIAFCHVMLVGFKVRRNLMRLFFGDAKKTSAISAIVLSIYGIGQLAVLVRRIALVNDTVRCYNSLSEWPINVPVRRSYAVIVYVSSVAVFLEIILDNLERLMKKEGINLEFLAVFAFVGFELQLIYTFHVIGQLYGDLNAYVKSGLINDMERIHQARHRNLALYKFCKKFNSHYNIDLIIHLSCYQLYVLFILFKLVKSLFTTLESENFFYSLLEMRTCIRAIRTIRLFLVFAYLIESSSDLHHKSVFTFYYIIRKRVNFLRLQTKEQLYLFLNELNATEVTITANYCYDVDKKFLYSVCGSIVAYLVLVVSFLHNNF